MDVKHIPEYISTARTVRLHELLREDGVRELLQAGAMRNGSSMAARRLSEGRQSYRHWFMVREQAALVLKENNTSHSDLQTAPLSPHIKPDSLSLNSNTDNETVREVKSIYQNTKN